eukprot:gnl/TRDRNA2_/TRDRNA2_196036_c0_seq1.p1 gnl/TRDRNA2_/TRDRNA2_196036_c0~~gnl/TRDRNA2_/TRDRNA2_196036_c0_seq1.p1  ORF type:complete len:371 (+),score=67.75 gnl/TRDRNA2_/TRDRNA2_196036_c0_seq1:100-1113(+)
MVASIAHDGDAVHVDTESELTFSIHLMSGETVVTISMKPAETVRALKRKLQKIEGTPPEEIRLVAGTSALSNRQTMGQVEVQHGVTLQLVKLPPSDNTIEISEEMRDGGGVVTLWEDIKYEFTDDDVDAYSEWLGMDPDKDQAYLWIAEEGLKCPLPHPWKVYATDAGEVFYFNHQTNKSVWDHPCDEFYRKLFQDLKEKDEREKAQQESEQDRRAKRRERLPFSKAMSFMAREAREDQTLPHDVNDDDAIWTSDRSTFMDAPSEFFSLGSYSFRNTFSFRNTTGSSSETDHETDRDTFEMAQGHGAFRRSYSFSTRATFSDTSDVEEDDFDRNAFQ